MAESVPSVQASTDGRLRVHLCLWPTHTHTHSAGRHGEVHPWGAVGVPSATARPCSVRVAAGRLHAGAGPGAVCRLPCGRRSGASSSCRAPARPRRHALSRTDRGSSVASARLRSVPTPWAGGGHGEPMDASRARLPDDSPAGSYGGALPGQSVIGIEVGPAGGSWGMRLALPASRRVLEKCRPVK